MVILALMETYAVRRHPNSRNTSTASRMRPEFPRTATSGGLLPIGSEQRLVRRTYNAGNYGAYECHTMTGFSENDNAGYVVVLTLLSRPFSRKTVNYCSVYRRRRAKFQFRGTLSV